MKRRRILGTLAAALAAPLPARAQGAAPAFPTRTMQVIVPIAAGGPTDIIGRILAQHLPALLGQSVVVDNRSGAGGQIGMRAGASAPPDGHTLLIGNTGSVAINPNYHPNAGYDPLADYAYVSMLMVAPVTLVVRADLPARTLPELVAHIHRAGPGFSFASSGRGQSPHIAAELFARAIGVDFSIAPYRGAAPAVNDLLAGTVQAMFDSTSSMPHVREGRLRAIAVANAQRSALLPEVPTMAEQGLAGFDVSSWYVAMAPAGTPAPVLARLSAAISAIMQRPEVAERLVALNATPLHSTPEEAQSFVAAQVTHWRRVLAEAGIRAE